MTTFLPLSNESDATLASLRTSAARLCNDATLSLDASRLANRICDEIEEEIRTRMEGTYGTRDIKDATDPPLEDCLVADNRYL